MSSTESKEKLGSDNSNDESKQKAKKRPRKKLNAFAPEFNISELPLVYPYEGEFGIATRPAYVPPAKLNTPKDGSSTHSSDDQDSEIGDGLEKDTNAQDRKHNDSQSPEELLKLQQLYEEINEKHHQQRLAALAHKRWGNRLEQPLRQAPLKLSMDKTMLRFGAQSSHEYAKTIGVSLKHKRRDRSVYRPCPEDLDPKFVNDPETRKWQSWELLEFEKRWLPGEGTFTTWKGYRYLIGKPIHIGVNGHIHYCYKYPVPNEKEGSGDEKKKKKLPPNVETVAAKVVPNTHAFAREIVTLRALQKCENVCRLFEVIESERTLISILELAQADASSFFDGTVALKHGWNLDKLAVREHFARIVISNVVQGLQQMHARKYLHCDLKCLNILLYFYVTDHSYHKGGVYLKAKLTDFGHSSHGETRLVERVSSDGMALVGTAGYVAPEFFKTSTICDYKVDIWSLGIVMFSMLVPGEQLFGDYMDLETLKRRHKRANKAETWSSDRPTWWSDFEMLSPEARDLIFSMTRLDSKERPSCEEILQHPWFTINNKTRCTTYKPELKYVDIVSASCIAQE